MRSFIPVINHKYINITKPYSLKSKIIANNMIASPPYRPLPKILALTGRHNSGKTTTANYLAEKYNYKPISFADALKKVVSVIYGFDNEILAGDTSHNRQLRNTVKDPIWNQTGIEALNYIGTDIFRKYFDEDVWIKILMRNIKEAPNSQKFVIVDCRFDNEFEVIRKLDGIVLVLYRDNNELIITQNDKDTEHISSYRFINNLKDSDKYIHNNSSIEELYKKIDELLFNDLITE